MVAFAASIALTLALTPPPPPLLLHMQVVLMDKWCNPFIEIQAIDRVHRIGQKRRVVVRGRVQGWDIPPSLPISSSSSPFSMMT